MTGARRAADDALKRDPGQESLPSDWTELWDGDADLWEDSS